MGNRIKQLREENHMTQVRLSIELEVTQETISAYESGRHFPSVQSLIKLSEIFNASCDYILGLSDCRVIEKDFVVHDEKEARLYNMWKRMDSYHQDLLLAYCDGLLASQNQR